jgi:hypothetical protein
MKRNVKIVQQFMAEADAMHNIGMLLNFFRAR